MITLAALMVIISGLLVALYGMNAGKKTAVIAITKAIPKGATITRAELESVQVAGVTGAIPVAQVNTVVGKTAVVGMVPGQIITTNMLTANAVPGPGQAVVGLSLDPTKVPVGIAAGSTVNVVQVPAQGSNGQAGSASTGAGTNVLASAAQVLSVTTSASSNGSVLLTVVVPADAASTIAAASTQNQVAVIITPGSGQ